MVHSIKRLIGYRLAALDGEIGHLKDFYFDDGEWTIRYAVAEAGTWLRSRQVLLSPRAFGEIEHGEKSLAVQLTREQIKDSPPIDTQKPVSRQYEEEYHQYYGWPYYWQGAALWGMSGFPVLHQRSGPYLGEHRNLMNRKAENGLLRSVQIVSGYRVQSQDAIVGQFTDFLVASGSWAIQSCVVQVGSRLSGKQILVSPTQIDRISWDTSTMHVNVPESIILQAPEFSKLSLDECSDERIATCM